MHGSANCAPIYCATSQGISRNHIERFPGTVENKVQVVRGKVFVEALGREGGGGQLKQEKITF